MSEQHGRPCGIATASARTGAVLTLALLVLLRPTPGADAPGSGPGQPFESYTERISGTDVAFEMVAIPGGRFLMGSPEDEPGRADEEGPRHEVEQGPFWIGKFEVTWDEYDLFAFAEGLEPPPSAVADPAEGVDAVTRPTPPYGDESFGYGKGRQPVLSVSHHAAMEYARWLSGMTGRAYRLPTEAEWEYAARAGSETAYSFGDDPAALDDHAWYAQNAGRRPQPVGGKAPNAWGLYDMHGNVAEWCLDHYDAAAYAARAGTDAPARAPVLAPTDRRYPHVARGGSWMDPAAALRSAARRGSREAWNRRDPQQPRSIWWLTDGTFVGFRIARAVEEQPELRGIRSRVTRDSR